MSHRLQAFIAKDSVADAIRDSKKFPFVARLPFGLSLVPIDDAWVHAEDDRVRASYDQLGLPDYALHGAGQLWLEPVVAKVGLDHSAGDPVLFVRTEWFGGVGDSQGWWIEQASRIVQVSVDQGLVALGVQPTALQKDAWDAVGLGSYRSSDWDDWKKHEARGTLLHTRHSFGK